MWIDIVDLQTRNLVNIVLHDFCSPHLSCDQIITTKHQTLDLKTGCKFGTQKKNKAKNRVKLLVLKGPNHDSGQME